MQKLISIDLKGDFGFFRKPDTNNSTNTIILSYNMLHKPALLGIFGAIVGLEGYKEKGMMPAYFYALKDLKIGIEPLFHEKGNFSKNLNIYTDATGFNNKDKNGLPSTRIMKESILIKPAYRVYILLDDEESNQSHLYKNLKDGNAEFLPYFGKNEFSVWWDKESFKQYDNYEVVDKPLDDIKIKTLFLKQDIIKENKAAPVFDLESLINDETPYMYFERLPIGFDTSLFQYEMGDFVLSSFRLKKSIGISNLYYLNQEQYYVQLL